MRAWLPCTMTTAWAIARASASSAARVRGVRSIAVKRFCQRSAQLRPSTVARKGGLRIAQAVALSRESSAATKRWAALRTQEICSGVPTEWAASAPTGRASAATARVAASGGPIRSGALMMGVSGGACKNSSKRSADWTQPAGSLRCLERSLAVSAPRSRARHRCRQRSMPGTDMISLR